MMDQQTAIANALRLHKSGELEFGLNVYVVRQMEFDLIRGSVPREVRKELNNAVKLGQLGHLKKNGLEPEVYFHPDFKEAAIEARAMAVRRAVSSIAAVCST